MTLNVISIELLLIIVLATRLTDTLHISFVVAFLSCHIFIVSHSSSSTLKVDVLSC